MKLPFQNSAHQRILRRPESTAIPELGNSSICALYCAARVGGDAVRQPGGVLVEPNLAPGASTRHSAG